MRVLGIRRGYNGLINGDMVEMNLRSVSDILQKGGTILYTARCLEFKEESGIERAKQTCVETGLDGVVVIGGMGSLIGTLLGGVVLGVAQLLGGYFFGSGVQMLVAYIVLLVILAVRPNGLLVSGARK